MRLAGAPRQNRNKIRGAEVLEDIGDGAFRHTVFELKGRIAIFALVKDGKDPSFEPTLSDGIGRTSRPIHRRDGRLSKHRIRRAEFIAGVKLASKYSRSIRLEAKNRGLQGGQTMLSAGGQTMVSRA